MKKIFYKFSALFGLTLAVVSCNSSDIDGYEKNENGLYYKFYKKGENTIKPKLSDEIQMKFCLKIKSSDSILTDSRKVRPDNGIVGLQLRPSSFKGSLEDALMMMGAGDSASFIINADSFFLKTQSMRQLPPFIKPGDKLVADIKIEKITDAKVVEQEMKKRKEEYERKMKELEMKSKSDLEKYITDNKITAKPTLSGLYYIELKKGSGPKVLITDTVSVYYKGMFLDGTVFNDNTAEPKPVDFPVQGLIPAWQEAIPMMSVGTKAKLVCPHQVAYGPRGNQSIPPFANLVFELEIKAKKSGEKTQNNKSIR
ncbi:MAG: FKBP-type peptidyl-prolyl cis-trans isomerase [Bacteroidota bacterium]|jgi:FKBP-type peptidyl-prolyl cis-trans isomerase FkpA